MILYLVCDTSGSMSEDEKFLIMRGMVRAMEQFSRLGYECGSVDLKLIAWSGDARLVGWIPEQEFPEEMLVCEKAADAEALITLLGAQPEGKVLLLTDGLWPRDVAKKMKRWKERRQPDTLRIIKIGADADPLLKGPDVFAAEDLFAALDGWCEGGVA